MSPAPQTILAADQRPANDRHLLGHKRAQDIVKNSNLIPLLDSASLMKQAISRATRLVKCGSLVAAPNCKYSKAGHSNTRCRSSSTIYVYGTVRYIYYIRYTVYSITVLLYIYRWTCGMATATTAMVLNYNTILLYIFISIFRSVYQYLLAPKFDIEYH